MKQTEKIEMFFNWLMDNNYFTKIVSRKPTALVVG